MVIAGFDIATCSGCAIIDGDTVLRCSSFRPDGDNDAEIFTGFRSWFRGLLTYYKVDLVAIEQPLRSNGTPATMRTLLRLYGLRAIAMQAVHGLGLPPALEVNQLTWRKSFTGNHRASKEQTLALAQTFVPDLKSKDAAEALGVARHLQGVLREKQLLGTAA